VKKDNPNHTAHPSKKVSSTQRGAKRKRGGGIYICRIWTSERGKDGTGSVAFILFFDLCGRSRRAGKERKMVCIEKGRRRWTKNELAERRQDEQKKEKRKKEKGD
jgi:hypothetical protein